MTLPELIISSLRHVPRGLSVRQLAHRLHETELVIGEAVKELDGLLSVVRRGKTAYYVLPETQTPETPPPETQTPETPPPETPPPETPPPETQTPAETPPPAPAETAVFAADSTGNFFIRKGRAEIRLSADEKACLARFLERNLWKTKP